MVNIKYGGYSFPNGNDNVKHNDFEHKEKKSHETKYAVICKRIICYFISISWNIFHQI